MGRQIDIQNADVKSSSLDNLHGLVIFLALSFSKKTLMILKRKRVLCIDIELLHSVRNLHRKYEECDVTATFRKNQITAAITAAICALVQITITIVFNIEKMNLHVAS